MADSLVLTGVKDVKKHTGTEMLLTRPKRGGDTHSSKRVVERWCNNRICNALSLMSLQVGYCQAVLDTTSMSTNVRIDHDGHLTLPSIGVNEVSRAALFTDAFELIEHYVFPSISGGKVMTVTPPGGASRPGGAPADLHSNGTVTGPSGSTTPADALKLHRAVGGDCYKPYLCLVLVDQVLTQLVVQPVLSFSVAYSGKRTQGAGYLCCDLGDWYCYR